MREAFLQEDARGGGEDLAPTTRALAARLAVAHAFVNSD
jgi:hypothetical protein